MQLLPPLVEYSFLSDFSRCFVAAVVARCSFETMENGRVGARQKIGGPINLRHIENYMKIVSCCALRAATVANGTQ